MARGQKETTTGYDHLETAAFQVTARGEQNCCVHLRAAVSTCTCRVSCQRCIFKTDRLYRTKKVTAKNQIKPVSRNIAASLLTFMFFLPLRDGKEIGGKYRQPVNNSGNKAGRGLTAASN